MERFNKVNKKLQSVSIDLGMVEELYTSLQHYVQEVRSNFEHYEAEAISLVDTDEYIFDQRRTRTRKRHHDEIGSTADTVFTGRSKMIAEVNEIMDKLMSELEKRKRAYSGLNSLFGFLVDLPSMDVPEINSSAQKLVDQYPNDLNSRLLNECLHFGAFIPAEIVHEKGKRKPTALDLLKLIRSKNLESTFLNIDVALQIFLTTAATNCSGERSFSTLKRIKSVYRSTTGIRNIF